MMKLIQRTSNGNYASLLAATISEYLEAREDLASVRGETRVFTLIKPLCAFYDIFVPSLEQEINEADWIKELRTDKKRQLQKSSATSFSNLQLTAYMCGAIDYMVEGDEINTMLESGKLEDCEKRFQRFDTLVSQKRITRVAADFLIQMWYVGYTRQKERFENK